MRKLKAVPSAPLVVISVVALAATIIVGLQFPPIESRLKAAGYGIVDLELAFTAERAGNMLRAWGSGGREATRDSLFIDFPFMVSYALALAGFTLLITRRQKGRLEAAGYLFVFAPLVAAAFDALENVMLLVLLEHYPVPALPPAAAGVFASLKFLLLIVVIVYWLVCGSAWLIRRLRSRPAGGK